MSKTASLLTSTFGPDIHKDSNGKLVSSSQVLVPDLPSWTPLKTLGEDEGPPASDPEVDELSIRNATKSAMKRLRESPTNAQTTVETTVTARPTSKPKKARFNGVLITTKLPLYKKYRSQRKPAPAPASTKRVTSLVDALARTFDANRHTEDSFTHRSRTGLDRRDDTSTAPQTDVETTDAEDDRLQLNTLLSRTPLKRRFPRTSALTVSANTSEANSEETTPFQRDIPQAERLVKRLKSIQYESNPALIDAALGTVEAPISWDAELDFITRDEQFVISPVQTAPPASADDRMVIDEGNSTSGTPRKAFVPPSTQVGNEWRMPTCGVPKRAVLSPYLSRGAQFRQRLDAFFGENTTVRTDRVARPRPVSSAL